MENTKEVNTLVLFPSWLRLAVRNLIKYKSMTFIGSFSLVVGMSSFILMMLFVRYELSYDSIFEKSDRIFLLGQSIQDQESGGSSSHTSTSGIVAPTLKKEFCCRIAFLLWELNKEKVCRAASMHYRFAVNYSSDRGNNTARRS